MQLMSTSSSWSVFHATTTTAIYTLSLHDALPILIADLTLTASGAVPTFRYVAIYNDTASNDELVGWFDLGASYTLNTNDSLPDRKSTRLNSSHPSISYAVFCLKKKNSQSPFPSHV